MLPQVANAQAVTETDVDVTTPDGTADCYFVHPAAGQHPAEIAASASGSHDCNSHDS